MKRGPKTPQTVEIIDVPKSCFAMALRRTTRIAEAAWAHHRYGSGLPGYFETAIVSAYLQGVNDTMEMYDAGKLPMPVKSKMVVTDYQI